MKFNIITIFPQIFNSFLKESLIQKSIAKKLIDFNIVNLRDFTIDKHKTVDDSPYGGGAGMVIKIEPIYQALKKIQDRRKKNNKRKIILLTPAGKQFNQKIAQKFSQLEEITFVCGRYEGIDARVDNFVDEKISLGPYVLNGGEVATMAIIEATFRLLPGTIGNKKSIEEETFSDQKNGEVIWAEYPQYTRPDVFIIKGKKYKVPKILLSGNHQKIKEWKKRKIK